MSFILDALRKSDARRQQSGAPGLNSPEPPQPPPRRRRRLWPWLVAVTALLVIAGSAVYLVRPDWLPQSISGARQLSRVPSDEQPAEQAQDPDRSRRRTEPSPAIAEQAAADGESISEPRRDRRQPIAAAPERTVRREAPERESPPVPAEQATAELERRLADEARRRREAARQVSSEPDKPDEAKKRAAADQPDTSPASDPEVSQPRALNEGVAEYVRVWELPLSVRRQLPELHLTIHVYSPNEGERFVLINGERYVAGDSIDGARIVSISREGAIVDFRSHRFLLEPR